VKEGYKDESKKLRKYLQDLEQTIVLRGREKEF
jgi:hypothetical protein